MCKIVSRLRQIANNEGITVAALERSLGASKGVLSRAIANGTDIQTKWIEVLVENYPQYSAHWLLTGEGSMLCDTNETMPVVAISALTGKRVDRIWSAIDTVYANFSRSIPTARLNTWLAGIRETGHTVSKGKAVLRMKYLTQTGTCPPYFTFFVNRPDVVDDNYERYLENRMREAFDLTGTPIRFKFKKKD